ncbi:hypothetical protein CHLNCDRAFT_142327 [Chlorella variabilis]|uniref:GPI transamidase component PIG-T n=1 Tax=Chlorella variabilis TaxID=554065 RepID=E1Z8B0_CHLVA|nr:hypothetical protein CHLNCDRAFT_142327 [Chlorella variabilis]EFN58313.1 hypothetical protein CHLNCDRAFT_142327 [Chlorella variabilis]|eukprot:XP_005850415.1 hypothetical protein CHLNCDRAFT_142327 [Chlorella variabilis]
MLSWAGPVIVLLLRWGVGSAAAYTEELALQQLSDGSVLAHFEFSAAAPLHAEHAGSFPAALLALARRHGVRQLELSLTQGRWTWEQQRQVAAGAGGSAAASRPAGLELKVSFDGSTRDTQAAYSALTQALGGMLCAGIATAPRLAVMAAPAVGWFAQQQPAAVGGGAASSGKQRRQGQRAQQIYAWLPQEGLCSENLAAWRRLLPCRHHAGLGALLQPVQLAAAPYHSLGLQLWVPQGAPLANASASASSASARSQGGQQEWLELRQVLTAVLPAADQQEQQQEQQGRGLLEALFGSSPPAACPAADSSTLYLPGGRSAAAAHYMAKAVAASRGACRQHDTPAGPLLACDIAQQVQQAQQPEQQQAQISGQQQQQHLHPPASLLQAGQGGGAEGGPPQAGALHLLPLQVVQHTIQRGPLSGTLVVGIRVPAAAAARAAAEAAGPQLLLHVMQLLPWQLRVDATSLQVLLDGQPLHPRSPQLVWQSLDVRPDRTATLELLLRLPSTAAAPAGSDALQAGRWHEVRVQVGYRAAFVSVFDHAPDASRGVDIPPALATLAPDHACTSPSSPSSSSGDGSSGPAAPPLLRRLQAGCAPRQQYSGSGGGGLAPLPLPDLSMPFNVICFTSTLLAILLGGVANVVLRSPAELAGQAASEGGAPAWRRKLRRVAALLLPMCVLAVYLDRDLQRQLEGWAHQLVHVRARAPEQHGEL